MALGLRFNIFARDNASGPLDNIGDAAGRTGRALGGIGKAAALGLGGAAVGAVAAFSAGLKGGVEEAISYQRITDQLTQTIKSTGGAAGVSTAQLKEYAGQLESISGVDEELILNSQNVLLTFTGIRNEVGKGNDVYNQASLAALNLSTTLGTDVSGAAVQVGKALNDPLKGITALGKAGVSFTAAQKEQIKALVASGDTMAAQKIILAELNKEFGGAAAAAGKGFGGDLARLKDTVSDTFREIATRALPTLTRLAEFLATHLPAAIDATFAFFTRLRDQAVQVFNVLFRGDFTGGPFQEDSGFILGLFKARELLGAVGTFVSTQVVPAFQRLGTFLTTSVFPALQQVGQFVAGQMQPVFAALVRLFQESLLPALRGLFQRLEENKPQLLTIARILGGVAAAALMVASKISTTLIPIVGRMAQVISAAIGVVIGVVGALVRFGTALVNTGRAVANFVSTAVGHFREMPGKVGGALSSLGSKLAQIATSALQTMRRVISDQVSKIVSFFGSIPDRLFSALGDFVSRFYNAGKEMVLAIGRGIKDFAFAPINALKDAAGKLGGLIPGSPVKDGPLRTLNNGYAGGQIVKMIAGGILKDGSVVAEALTKQLDKAKERLKVAQDAVVSIVSSRRDLVSSVAGNLKGSVSSLFDVTSITDVIGKLKDQRTALSNFVTDIANLRTRGFNNNTLNELLAAGPDQAGALTSILSSASTDQLAQVNGLRGQISGLSGQAATQAGTATFGTQQAVLQAQLEQNRRQAAAAEAAVAELKKVLAELKKAPAKNMSVLTGSVRA